MEKRRIKKNNCRNKKRKVKAGVEKKEKRDEKTRKKNYSPTYKKYWTCHK